MKKYKKEKAYLNEKIAQRPTKEWMYEKGLLVKGEFVFSDAAKLEIQTKMKELAMPKKEVQ